MVDLPLLEEQKRTLLAELATWSPARLAFHPSPGEWSALQLIDHLIKTESEILLATKRQLPNPHRIGLRDKLGYLFIERIFKTDRKVKAPASVPAIQPAPHPDLSDLLARWNATRLDLAAFVPQLTPAQTTQGIFRHPVSGWMDLPRILGFFSVHITHHRFQLNRLAAASQDL